MTSIAFLLRLALLLLAPLLIAPMVTAQPGSSRAMPSAAQIDFVRAVALDVETEFGETVEVDLLRPAAWLRWHGLSEGSRMPFASTELGIDGIATVVGIGSCPESAAGSEPGNRAVTGLVRRTAQNWVTVHLVGQSEPIRATPEHPIWSKSRQRWVGAGDLEAGEELDAAGDCDEPPSPGTARAVVVERIERHASPAAVFNLEVHRAHTYRVGAGGVLVHNEAPGPNPVCGLPRVNSANKTDAQHAFPDIVDNYADQAMKTKLNSGAELFEIEGGLEIDGRMRDGKFEWIVQDGQVTHRRFVEGATPSGVVGK